MSLVQDPPFKGETPDAGLFDLASWPIVFVRFPELDEDRRSERVLEGLGRLVDQEQRFVLIWIPPSHAHENEPHEDEKRASVWIKQRKGDLGRHCAGYIYLTSEPGLRAKLTKSLAKMGKLFPFPKVLVDSREEAVTCGRRLLAGKAEPREPHTLASPPDGRRLPVA